MKSFRKELWFDIPTRVAFANITKDVRKALKESGVHEGLCLVVGVLHDLLEGGILFEQLPEEPVGFGADGDAVQNFDGGQESLLCRFY